MQDVAHGFGGIQIHPIHYSSTLFILLSAVYKEKKTNFGLIEMVIIQEIGKIQNVISMQNRRHRHLKLSMTLEVIQYCDS